MAQRYAALMGALVADAASMGTHWIYSPERVSMLSNLPHFPFLSKQVVKLNSLGGPS